jgi:hypothetical protein
MAAVRRDERVVTLHRIGILNNRNSTLSYRFGPISNPEC